MAEQKNSLRTIIFLVVSLAAIGWFLMFAIRKNNESGQRSAQCELDCAKNGHAGFEFRWDILSGPVCQCID